MQAHFGGQRAAVGPQQVSGGLAFARVYTGTGPGESSLGLSFSALPPSTPWACVGLMEHKCSGQQAEGCWLFTAGLSAHVLKFHISGDPRPHFSWLKAPVFTSVREPQELQRRFLTERCPGRPKTFSSMQNGDREQSWTRSLLPTPHSPTMLALFSSKSLSQRL